jgi:dipeptide transport system substrate-binding protein
MVAVAIATLALTSPAGPALAAKGTLVYCAESAPESVNAQLTTSSTSYDVTEHIFDRLVRYGRGTAVMEPGLAERWEVSPDGRTYTFFLRPGVKFHSSRDFKPTRTLTADDVVFTIDRQWKKDHPFHAVAPVYPPFLNLRLGDLLERVEKVDDLTVRFVLRYPDAAFLDNLAHNSQGIHSAEHAEAMMKAGTPERVDTQPIGTGSYQLVQYQKDTLLRLRVFPDHWEGPAPTQQLVYVITPDPAVRQAKLQAGECHIMSFPNLADVPVLEADPNLTLMKTPLMSVGYLAFNTQKKPFDDVRVRRALSMAVDRKAILETIYQGYAVMANGPLPPGSWAHDPTLPDIPYDPEAAKALLAEAGYPDGFETTLWAMPVQRPYNPNARRMAEMIQTDFARIGVKVAITSYEWGEYLRRTRFGEHDMAQLGWSVLEPSSFMEDILGCASAVPGGGNVAKWCHPGYQDLMTRARRTNVEAERAALYREGQRIFQSEAPWLPIAFPIAVTPMRNEVKDFRASPYARHWFYGVTVE